MTTDMDIRLRIGDIQKRTARLMLDRDEPGVTLQQQIDIDRAMDDLTTEAESLEMVLHLRRTARIDPTPCPGAAI